MPLTAILRPGAKRSTSRAACFDKRYLQMTKTESRAAFSLAGIFSLRMLGLFMIYPVFTFYAKDLTASTPVLIGLALGAYGLTQALLQIPLGFLSDRFGRKHIIAGGLVILAVGSVVAALSTSIYGVIFGRILQGAGAVGSTILALNADLTREESRTKAMATIGITIGLAFAVAMVLGPLIAGWAGVPGIFWFTAVLALLGLVVLYGATPEPPVARSHRDAEAVPALFKRVLSNNELLRLDLAIFILHTTLTASFIALPKLLSEVGGVGEDYQWVVYLPVLVVSVVIMLPAIIVAEAKRQMKPVFVGSVGLLLLSQVILFFYHNSFPELVITMIVFFTAFNVMEATLPSMISKIAPADAKGTALGVYSSAQFFGIFVGGAGGGWAYSVGNFSGVFLFCAVASLIWLVVAATMPKPRFARTHMVNVGQVDDARARQLAGEIEATEGVFEAVVVPARRGGLYQVRRQSSRSRRAQPFFNRYKRHRRRPRPGRDLVSSWVRSTIWSLAMASRGINKAIIVGNLGADPETRYTAGGTAVTNLSVATSDSWRDKTSGEMQERTEWHRIVFFARLAEVAGEYLRKGSKVYVEGRIQTRKWQGQDGQDRYTTEIVGNEMQMLDSKGSGGSGGGSAPFSGSQQSQPQRPQQQPARAQGQQQQPQQQPAGDPGFDDDLDDDIPF